MEWTTAACAIAIVVLIGRNDGSLIASLAQSTSRGAGHWAPLLVIVALPVLPLLGIHHVANGLRALAAGPSASPAAMTAFLLAISATIILSLVLSTPNSITLAIMGAITGSAAATGAPIDLPRVWMVLVIAMIAPVAATVLAWWLARLPLHLGRLRAGAVLAGARKTAFVALVLAYSANDGQKVLFLVAIASETSIASAARSPTLVAAELLLFGAGTWSGLRRSGRALRHGASSPNPVQSFWSQASAVVIVSLGASLGTPMSMTQATVGGIVGAGLSRGWRALRWAPVVRIACSWLWSVPVAATLSFAMTLLVDLA